MSEPREKRRRFPLKLRGETRTLGDRTWVMGILNVTPDSFSDGGRHNGGAVAHGLALFEAGAEIVDVGGESTRPGASPVTDKEECARVIPVIEGLRAKSQGAISVDTTKARVAEAALDAGADLVNDVSGLLFDSSLGSLVARRKVPVVLMHLRGTFRTMHDAPVYKDLMGEVTAELRGAIERAMQAGVAEDQIIVDPGIGFAKDPVQSLEVVRRFEELHTLERPILAGPSRKRFIGKVLGAEVGARLLGTAAAVAACILSGAHIVRVHDVREMLEVSKVCDAILDGATA